ncbi:hypothetical protein GLAREA_09641 [Glarea lozoyensis ATCC 20868]|uniref:SGNH hydrolase n=1 Tax=Glarea lozoyensis (strain ATCC 20868 / MF5171) TaxID=1116229 RepID=S3CS67_GLAL2|nr:uncharacterized protein GLAREA_09641 [Glarea lozoyensis ATCC 20868]EPE28520.1 hypothetical protein GLAREA_09641 [Glarea lozoyensis ATCC 20868]
MLFRSNFSLPTPKRRLGASIFLSFLSLSSIYYFLCDRASVGTRLQKISEATGLGGYTGIWKWGDGDGLEVDEEGSGEAVNLVVFGDSWVDDTPQSGQSGRGKSWARVVCEEIHCSSYTSFAATQPSDAYPANPPTGVMASNAVYRKALEQSRSGSMTNQTDLLPDLGSQIQSFIGGKQSAVRDSRETIFVLSLGFWEVYHYASMEFEFAESTTDSAVDGLFDQIELLYRHAVNNTSTTAQQLESNSSTPANAPVFRVMIPKLIDPSITPGWLTHRPVPLKPSSIAEQQKNAAYLTSRWNLRVENKMIQWMKSNSIENEAPETPEGSPDVTQDPRESQFLEKDFYYYNVARQVLDMIVEHQLEKTGISDASGLGKGSSPFKRVQTPCLSESQLHEDLGENFDELNGYLLCKTPDEYMFWDAFNIGSVAKRSIGSGAATMISGGHSLRARLSKSYSNNDAANNP